MLNAGFFFTRERLICHVMEKSLRCRVYMLQFLEPIPLERCNTVENEARQKSRQLHQQGKRRHNTESMYADRAAGPQTLQSVFCLVDHKTGLKNNRKN